jgi:hypothetical protein
MADDSMAALTNLFDTTIYEQAKPHSDDSGISAPQTRTSSIRVCSISIG